MTLSLPLHSAWKFWCLCLCIRSFISSSSSRATEGRSFPWCLFIGLRGITSIRFSPFCNRRWLSFWLHWLRFWLHWLRFGLHWLRFRFLFRRTLRVWFPFRFRLSSSLRFLSPFLLVKSKAQEMEASNQLAHLLVLLLYPCSWTQWQSGSVVLSRNLECDMKPWVRASCQMRNQKIQ